MFKHLEIRLQAGFAPWPEFVLQPDDTSRALGPVANGLPTGDPP
jgi:hypothetical protein